MTDDTHDTDGRDGGQRQHTAGEQPAGRRGDQDSIVDASRRDFLKTTAGAGAVAAGLGSGIVGAASAEVVPTPPLYVDGNLIKDPDGATVKLRGVNMVDPKRANVTAPARGKNAEQIVDLLTDTDRDWYSRAIRIPVQPVDIGEHQPGEGPEPVAFTESQLQTYLETHLDPVIERCLQRGAYAIVDYHRHRDIQWNNETLAEEVDMFWDVVAPRYADQPHVMYEVYNEPTEPGMWGDPTQQQNWADTWRDWKATAQPWVDTIRSHAPDNLVLIGSPSWTQSPEGALVEPFDGSNLAYTFHIYPGHNSSTSQNWEDASSSNNGEGVAGVYEEHPLFVTEFGWEQGGGQYISGMDEFGTAFLEWLESSDAIHWTAWIGDPVWRPVMFERSFSGESFADNIGNPYAESVPEQCPDLPCEWSLTTGSGGMGDDIKQALIDHRDDNPPTVAYDQQAPSAPTGLSTSNVTETTVDVSWSGVSDQGEAGLSHYAVSVDGETVTEVPAGTTSTTVEGLQADATVTIGVSAVDRARNESAAATTQVTTDAFEDSTAPDAPSNLSAPNVTHQSVTASWDGVGDAGDAETAGLSHYNVYLDGSLQREVGAGTTQVQLGGLDADTPYEIGVSAVDRAGNESSPTTESVTTDLATAGSEDLLINNYDGSPPFPGNNDLGNWNGTGGLDTASVEDGALQIEYSSGGWYGTQVSQDVTDYPTLKLNVSGETGGEEQGIEIDFGGTAAMLGDVATGTITTGRSILTVDLEAAGVNLEEPGQLTFRFYDAGEGSIAIDELWLDSDGSSGGGQDDTAAPTAPTNLTSPSQSQASVELAWDAASDEGGSGLDHYTVYVDGSPAQQVSAGTTSAELTDLDAGTSYDIGVSAVDAAGNESSTTTLTVTTAGGNDDQAPSAPSNVTSPSQTASSALVEWDAASDEGGSGLDHYVVYVDGTQDQTVSGSTSATVSGLSADTSYEVAVSAVDGAGNESDATATTLTTAQAGDGEPGDGEEPGDGDETPTDALVVNDYDGSPAWPDGNDLGHWNGAGSFENGGGSGEVVDGALELEYENAGWFVEQIMEDVSGYSELVLVLRGENGGEDDEFVFSLGGVRTVFSDVADSEIGTSTTEVRVDLESAGVDRSNPGELRFNFWQGAQGSSTVAIEEIRFGDSA